MRINDINTQILIQRYGNASKVRTGSVEQAAAPGSADNVALSPEAKGWMDALKAAREYDPVDQQKVDEMSRKIARGAYSVSAREVAESMLRREINEMKE